FSSDRRKTDDIYHFKASEMQFQECDSMTENKYCFSFYDAFQITNDTIPVVYIWDFSNGIKKQGVTVKHCFPGPGSYEVKLYITDSITDDSVINQTDYRFELKDAEQVYINAHQAGVVNKELRFDGLKTNLPGFKITEYLWDFGSGFRIRGPIANYTFTQKGEYIVKLGLTGEKNSTGNYDKACAWRSIRIYEDYQELAAHTATELSDLEGLYTYIGYIDINTANKVSDVSETMHDNATKTLEPLKTVVLLTNDITEYQKREIFNILYGIAGSYLYMDNNVIDASSREKLLPIIRLLKNNSNLKLEIAVHIYYHESSDENLINSESWATNLHLFFIDNGITPDILSCKGYGDIRPYPDTTTETNTDKTSRVEFIFIDNEH
ncbi:MAG: PKD domain-containing protein, partial [Bacteroidales bacterium]